MKKDTIIGLTVFVIIQVALSIITSKHLTIIVDRCDWPVGIVICSLITGAALTFAGLAGMLASAYKNDAKNLKSS